MELANFRVLLIEDDESDYALIRHLLAGVQVANYELHWVRKYDELHEATARCDYDVYLLDYRFGTRDGLQLLREIRRSGCTAPVIFLTGYGSYELDLEAMRAGAADFLSKDELSERLIERSIRYAIERRNAEEALRRSESDLRKLSNKLLTTQEEERKRIARELHDSIGSSLVSIKFAIENILATGTAKGSNERVHAIVKMTQDAIEEIRRMITALRPSVLDDLGLVATIDWYCRQFGTVYPSIAVKHKVSLEEKEIPEALKIVVFRVVQEAFNNVAKYSKADLVNLSLKMKGDTLELVIKDNGVGFKTGSKLNSGRMEGGYGISNMKERIELSGGSFIIRSSPGNGTKVQAIWPCTAQDHSVEENVPATA